MAIGSNSIGGEQNFQCAVGHDIVGVSNLRNITAVFDYSINKYLGDINETTTQETLPER